ncbi:MAG: hypothetical protein WAM58_19775, partial [Candidatus Acidiferrum sp.]
RTQGGVDGSSEEGFLTSRTSFGMTGDFGWRDPRRWRKASATGIARWARRCGTPAGRAAPRLHGVLWVEPQDAGLKARRYDGGRIMEPLFADSEWVAGTKRTVEESGGPARKALGAGWPI